MQGTSSDSEFEEENKFLLIEINCIEGRESFQQCTRKAPTRIFWNKIENRCSSYNIPPFFSCS
jgi:hypothetical protein